jgi:hypothetical protein
MTFGVRVTLTPKDKATLAVVAQRAPHLVDVAWEERARGDEVVLFSDHLDEDLAVELRQRGVDVVRDPAAGKHAVVPALPPPPRADLVEKVRKARGLLEAVRPVPSPETVPAEAVFFARVDGGGAQRLLERLLLMGRDDVLVGEVGMKEGPTLLLKVPRPPVYLLMRAREEPQEGVVAYVRGDDVQRVYTPWGTVHPLSALLEDRLQRAERTAFVSLDGAMQIAKATWPVKPILDAVNPKLEARTDVLDPARGELTFPVRLRLGPADPVDPELWVLTPEQLFRLESFVDTSPGDEVGRILVSRLGDADGRPRYVVRESVRPQLTRLGPRIASIVESTGFARAVAFDNLYLPPARRLVPQLARDQLKALLRLEGAAAVIVDEDTDGMRVTRIQTLEDAPLSRFTTWIATDRREELDRILEDAVASFPGVHIERPQKKPPEQVEAEVKERPAPRAPRSAPVVHPQHVQAQGPREAPVASDVAAVRAEARALEEAVLGARASDAKAWQSLGLLKGTLDEHDDAATCLEVSLFLGGDARAVAGELARERRAVAPTAAPGTPEATLLELALRDRPSRDDVALLGARLLEAIARGDALDEDLLHHATNIFLAQDILVSRRLQWAVLHAICARAKDSLGATRAKEAVLGGLNEHGLSETTDLPRFVRAQLALQSSNDDGAGANARSRQEQLVHLERLFANAVKQPLKLTDSRDAFLRAIFAVGLGRLGGRAPEIVRSLQAELDAHDPPNRALLRLYIARLSHFITRGTVQTWKAEVDGVLQSLPRPEDRRVVEWLVKRSLWLRPTPPEDPPSGLRPALERHLATAAGRPDDLAGATEHILTMQGLYDYEIATSLERMLKVALATGRDEIIAATLVSSMKVLTHIRILAHRVRALGACVRAAATLEDTQQVDECLEGIASAARAPNVPSVRDLLVAVKPALAALRRLGAQEAAQRFLSSMEPVATKSDRETGPLLAALSDGFLQLGDVEHARALVAQALARALASTTHHVDRYEAGAAILEALTHWDLDARAAQCEGILADLSRFTDTFTTSRYFHTHQILIAERLVETLADDVTLRSDRLQAYLDAEEQQIRRRVLSQWSALCGR